MTQIRPRQEKSRTSQNAGTPGLPEQENSFLLNGSQKSNKSRTLPGDPGDSRQSRQVAAGKCRCRSIAGRT